MNTYIIGFMIMGFSICARVSMMKTKKKQHRNQNGTLAQAFTNSYH